MNQNNSSLIKKCLKGDRTAMQKLYEQHEQYWFRLCLRYGRNRSEAQDILQEGLVSIFKNLRQFDIERGSFSAWSNRVIVTTALQHFRQAKYREVEDLSAVVEKEDYSEGILDKISAKELTQIIQELPDGYRMVFNLYEIEGYKHSEIAEMLNISIGTSKSQLSKAKKELRIKLEGAFR